MGPDLMRVLDRYYNNSFENIGNHDSFVWYGPRWAQAATAPGKLYKMYSTEGGIRVPFLVRYPQSWPQGRQVGAFASVMDITPTFLELAGIQHPVPSGQQKALWKGNKVYGIRGKSWTRYMARLANSNGVHGTTNGINGVNGHSGQEQEIYGPEDFVGWENIGRAALRKGRYKIVFATIHDFGKNTWELYDILSDPGETMDLADTMPDKVKEMKADWDRYCSETGTVWGEPIKQSGGYNPPPKDAHGGDPIEENRAWMAVGNNEML